MVLFPKTAKPVFVLAAVVLAGLIGFSLFQVFKNIPLFGPVSSSVTKEAKRIGLLYQRQQAEAIEGVKEGFKDMGYTNVSFEEAKIIPGPNMFAEAEEATKQFIANKVDLIFTGLELQAISAVKATKEMGSDIPIVFLVNFHDPVKYGLAKSFRSSENNATGVVLNLVEVIQKQLEFLRKIDPSIKKIGTFGEGFIVPPVGEEFYAELKAQAPRLGFEIVEYKTAVAPPQAEQDWYKIAGQIKPGDIDAVYHIAGHHYEAQEAAESELAGRLGIPMVAPLEDLPNGGHFGYSGDFKGAGKQAVVMMDKIFRGTKPSDIPLEFTSKNVLMIYLDRAKKAGIEFPDSMLSIAEIK